MGGSRTTAPPCAPKCSAPSSSSEEVRRWCKPVLGSVVVVEFYQQSPPWSNSTFSLRQPPATFRFKDLLPARRRVGLSGECFMTKPPWHLLLPLANLQQHPCLLLRAQVLMTKLSLLS